MPCAIAFLVVTLGAMFSTNGCVQWAIVVLTIASATWIAWMLWRRGTRAVLSRSRSYGSEPLTRTGPLRRAISAATPAVVVAAAGGMQTE